MRAPATGSYALLSHSFAVEGDNRTSSLAGTLLDVLVGDAPAATVYRVDPDGPGVPVTSSGEGRHLRARDIGQVIWHASRRAVHQAPADLTCVHAAAIDIDDGAVLLVGESGSGKSTMSAALLAAGYPFLSDEMAVVDRDLAVRAFRRPLILKTLGPLSDRLARTVGAIDIGDRWCVPAPPGASTRPARVVAILERGPDGPTTVEPLSTADATAVLYTHAAVPAHRRADALHRLSALASACRCVRLAVGDVDGAVGVIAELAG